MAEIVTASGRRFRDLQERNTERYGVAQAQLIKEGGGDFNCRPKR